MSERGPSPEAEPVADQPATTSDVVEVARSKVKEIIGLLEESYDHHPNRLVRAALKKAKELTT